MSPPIENVLDDKKIHMMNLEHYSPSLFRIQKTYCISHCHRELQSNPRKVLLTLWTLKNTFDIVYNNI